MNSFWKNEWDLFTQEVDTAVNFLMQPVDLLQPVEITFGLSSSKLMLKPTNEEVESKKDVSGFWKKEWAAFENEFDSAVNFLMQPVKFK